ncbi:MAG: HlyD family efflux transporter periplasmic adaptor subunit [Candidatus Hinthialibacter antarcticus]|nr:HlyD family efflux transporter periplasmic adaptor subunit [Candidatus Hinthialibacter antarcticus]
MSKHGRNQEGFVNRPSVWLMLIVSCVLAVGGYMVFSSQLADSESLNYPIYDVQQGPLTISESVAGTIQARDKVVIVNDLEGQSTILYLIPEGTKVKEGELLVELDSSSLQDSLVDQSISVQNAEASYINARESLAIIESQSQSDIDQAKLVFDFAVLDLQKYKEGEYPKLLDERESEIKLKEEELSQAKETLRWSEVLFNEKYLSQTVFQKDELAANRSKIQLDMAKGDLKLLEDYEYKRQFEQLSSDVKQAEMALERTKRQANASIVQASAELQAKLSEFDRQKGKLEKLEDQIVKAKIYAPQEGLVVYATSVRQRRFGNDEPLEEGRNVREREELIHLPTTASYISEVKIHESSLEKINVGLPVVITIDALPGKTYYGRVSVIAPLPDSQSFFSNPDLKVYNSQILIDGNGEDLRSGMGCQAEIIIAQFENTTYIPVQAVLKVGDQPTVFVMNGNEMEQRAVEIGPDNNRLIQIASGLKEGEKVVLTPPLAAGEVNNKERNQKLIDIPEMAEITPAPSRSAERRDPQAGQQGGRGDGAPAGGPPGPGANVGGPGGGQRPNLNPEQVEEMRKRIENMSPEERAAMQKRIQQGQQGQRGDGERGQRGGGQGGERQRGAGGGQERQPREGESN